MKNIIELKRIEESPEVYDILTKRIATFFRDTLYIPLLRELNLPQKTLQNARNPSPLKDALFRGKVSFSGGTFTGKFNSGISKELRKLGAKFDRKTGSYKITDEQLPQDVRQMISAGESQMRQKLSSIDRKLSQLLTEDLAAHFKCENIFDKTLFKADQSFKKNVKNITVVPDLTEQARKRIAEDWQNNLKLYIRDWTKEQISDLRGKIKSGILEGKRRAEFVPDILKVTKTIQKSHEQALNKAKFLAHQESRLLMASFKQTRYEEAGVNEYIWRCVHRPHDSTPNQHTPGNVRYSHGLLDGKIFSWNNPPITTAPGETTRRNNPGQDYNCRCFARPILRKK